MLISWKRYKFLTILSMVLLAIFSLFLHEKIDFERILLLSFAMAAFIESIYDIKNRTVDKFFYIDSDPYNHLMRYLMFIVSFLLLAWVVYDIFTELQ